MLLHKLYIILPVFLFISIASGAQDITGTWEGELGNDEFIQVNVIQVNNNLCGYTWDYVYTDHRSYCKAYFTGSYDKKHNEWELDGESFIENSGSHVLMKITLTNAIADGKTILKGTCNTSLFLGTFLGNMLESFFGKRSLSAGPGELVVLRKTSEKPQKILDKMNDCYEQKKITKSPDVKPPVRIKRTDSVKKAVPLAIIKQDDSITIPVVPVIVKHDLPPVVKIPGNDHIALQMGKRKNIEEGHVVVNTKSITLSVYDNGVVDGDSVSIFFNGKLLLSHQRLEEKPIVLNIELDENRERNELVLFAENLGSIPPNTALVVVTAGDKRYELFSKASLDENAVLVFEYKERE